VENLDDLHAAEMVQVELRSTDSRGRLSTHGRLKPLLPIFAVL
jgi:hypothetical protein